MVYGIYNYSYWGESKPTNITGGPHIVALIFPDPLDAMESTEEPDFEGIEEISYDTWLRK